MTHFELAESSSGEYGGGEKNVKGGDIAYRWENIASFMDCGRF